MPRSIRESLESQSLSGLVLRGPFTGHLAIFADMKPRERVEILLQLLGGEQRVTLAKKDIEAVR
jgi:hypothetical protein